MVENVFRRNESDKGIGPDGLYFADDNTHASQNGDNLKEKYKLFLTVAQKCAFTDQGSNKELEHLHRFSSKGITECKENKYIKASEEHALP